MDDLETIEKNIEEAIDLLETGDQNIALQLLEEAHLLSKQIQKQEAS